VEAIQRRRLRGPHHTIYTSINPDREPSIHDSRYRPKTGLYQGLRLSTMRASQRYCTIM
jgi:hypothetical protein